MQNVAITRYVRRAATTLIGAVYLVVATAAHADAGADLQTFFQNSTLMLQANGAQEVASQSGDTLTLGSFQARAPISTYQLYNFTPPHFSPGGGCGGIDWYLGSFSFINKAQFIAMLQNIAQNAQGYIFQLAISAISPMISNMMQTIEAKMQALNMQSINSCEAGMKLVSLAAGPGFDWLKQNECSNTDQSNPATANTDFFSSQYWCGQVNNIDTQLNNNLSSSNASVSDIAKLSLGNPLFNALVKAGLQPSINPNDANMVDLIQSITGTVLNPVATPTTTYTGTCNNPGACNTTLSPDAPKGIVNIKSFLYSPDYGVTTVGPTPPTLSGVTSPTADSAAADSNTQFGSVQYLKCNDYSLCESPSAVTMPANLTGQYIMNNLLAIANKIEGIDTTPLTASQLGLIGASPIPFFGMMQYAEDVQPGAAKQFVNQAMINYLGLSIIDEYFNVADGYLRTAVGYLQSMKAGSPGQAAAAIELDNWAAFMKQMAEALNTARSYVGSDPDTIMKDYYMYRSQALERYTPALAQRMALAAHLMGR